MKKHLLTILFVLGLSAAVALAQSTAPGQVPSATEGAHGSMQQPDRTGAAAQSGAQTQPLDNYGSMDKDKDKDKEKDKKQSSMANVDDESLHRQVHEQLASNPDLQNVQITVKNGKVTLEGSVPKKEDKKEAERLAKAIPGVKGVKDRLSVNASAGSSGSASNMGGVSGAAATTGSAAGENKSADSGQGIAAQTGATAGAASSTSNPPSSASAPSAANPPDQSSAASQSGQTGATAGASVPPSASSSTTVPADQSSMSAGASATTGGVSGQATSNPSSANPPPSAPSSIGAQAGSSSSGTTGQTSDPSSQSSMGAQSQTQSQPGSMSAGDEQLQQQIQTALKNDPSLANANIVIGLTSDSIELSGDVATGKEKKTAQRIAESYAGNRKVKNNLTVSGKGAGAKDSTTPSANPKSEEKPPKN